MRKIAFGLGVKKRIVYTCEINYMGNKDIFCGILMRVYEI